MPIHGKPIYCNKDTSVLNDDISGGLVEDHLVEDVDDLTHKFIVFLLGWKEQHKQMKNIIWPHKIKHFASYKEELDQ